MNIAASYIATKITLEGMDRGIRWPGIACDRLVCVRAVLRVAHDDEVLLGYYAVDLFKRPRVVVG